MSLRRRDRLALSIAPLALRVGLGLVFVWSGAGKFFAERLYTPEQCAVLSNMGVDVPTGAARPNGGASTPTGATTPPSNPGAGTPLMAPPSGPLPESPSRPKTDRPSRGTPSKIVPQDVTREVALHAADPLLPLAETAKQPSNTRRQNAAPTNTPTSSTPPANSGTPANTSGGVRTAADFPHGATLRNLYGVTLLIKNAATPKTNAEWTYWPSWAASGSWPIALAWVAGLVELVGGVCLLLGLFTRLSAAAILGTMLVAMWLTELGPAVQAGKTMFLILPDKGAGKFFDPEAWRGWLLQAALICMALTAMLLGPGPLSLDHGVFHDGDDDEPAPSEKKSGRPI